MESVGNNRVTVLAQAGHNAKRTLINLVPQPGYDGEAAHNEGEQIFRALLRGLPGYTFERIAALMLQHLSTHAEENADEDLAIIYRLAWHAVTGDRTSATGMIRAYEELVVDLERAAGR